MKIILTLFTLGALLLQGCSSNPSATVKKYDLVVYGGTSAGVVAAIQARRLGMSVALVCPEKHIGGMTTNGLGWTDSGRKETIGGIAREFYRRLKKYYDRPEAWIWQKPEAYSHYRKDDDAMWVFEPHVAEETFEKMIAEAGVPVFRDQWLNRVSGVEKDGTRIVSITMLDGNTYCGRMFIDATYEGDLMATAGVSYTTGREANAVYGETLNGVEKKHAIYHQFKYPVSPYVTPGDPASGLVPLVHAGDPGKDGEGDRRIQAYNFRLCLTTVPENKVAFMKPPHYDPFQYELLARYLQKGWRGVFNKFDPAPNLKTDVNNHGAFSTDYIGMNYAYPDASYEERQKIIEEHRNYQLGWLWFLAHDPRVPQEIHEEINRWGFSKDEFQDNNYWPHQIYVREARRMVSDFVMTEQHLRRLKPTPKPVGMGSYNMDSHNVQRYIDPQGFVKNEGDIEVNPGGPYPISYGSIVPKITEVTNLLVPVCVSSSHIAYGSVRMEPVFMILGQSAADAAFLAINEKVPIQEVDYEKLREMLIGQKQVISME